MMAASIDTSSGSWDLSELLFACELDVSLSGKQLQIKGLSMDSRKIEPGYLFLACQGTGGHGLDYFKSAMEAGAVAVLAEPTSDWRVSRLQELSRLFQVPVIPVTGLTRGVSHIARIFYRNSFDDIKICGVTGTNGKTSVTHFIAQLNGQAETGVIGGLGNGLIGKLDVATHTTPDAVSTQEQISKLKTQVADFLAMEVSSHALAQYRVQDVMFDTAVFTNFSQDHLDYHGSLESYAAEKKKLFRHAGLVNSVINIDDPLAESLLEEIAEEITLVTFSSKGKVIAGSHFVLAENIETKDGKTSFDINSSWGKGKCTTSLPGRFNIDNILAALAVCLLWNRDFDFLLKKISMLTSVEGRMQCFGGGHLPTVVVDYAHTPDALAQALTALKGYNRGLLKLVFGCGGNRDKGKRALMGEVASRLADYVIITDDNPRYEASTDIICDIQKGIVDTSKVQVIPNRAKAIAAAINGSAMEDLILIAGKGHEKYQQIGDLTHPFSDADEVQKVLTECQS